MKSEIFSKAIHERNQIKFLYGLSEIVLDPYYIAQERTGRKFIYGRLNSSSEIRKFEYKRIANIKVLENKKFSPIIPIISLVS